MGSVRQRDVTILGTPLKSVLLRAGCSIMQVFESQGFVTTREKEHATAAWLSSHPGNRVDSVRRTPQKSLTLAHLMPGLQSAWMGPERDEHLNAPAWFLVHSEDNTLFRVVNHVLDNGHFLCPGPTRSGKSILAGMMVAQWFRYPGAQVGWFDLDGSARCLTHCLGGHWYDLGSGLVGLQALRNIHDPVERAWAADWIRTHLLKPVGITARQGLNAFIDGAPDRLAQEPVSKRTLTGLWFVFKAMSNHVNIAETKRPQWKEHILALYLEVLEAGGTVHRTWRNAHSRY
jgi:type IV secretion system protein TrbE